MTTKNPCIGVCKFEDGTQLCRGCLRTRDERKSWKSLTEEAREGIVAERPQRETLLKEAIAAEGKTADNSRAGKKDKKKKSKEEKARKKEKKKAKAKTKEKKKENKGKGKGKGKA